MKDEEAYQRTIMDAKRFDITADTEAKTEVKNESINLVTVEEKHRNNVMFRLSKRTSKLAKLIRMVAYLKRFIKFIQARNKTEFVGDLNFFELEEARLICNRYAQDEFFDERLQLKDKGYLKTNSNLQKLCPFIDPKGIIRVGGRITNSELNMDLHPIILPKNHRITLLILQFEHEKHLHPGVNALFVIVRQKY